MEAGKLKKEVEKDFKKIKLIKTFRDNESTSVAKMALVFFIL